jgi:hypothetical protein
VSANRSGLGDGVSRTIAVLEKPAAAISTSIPARMRSSNFPETTRDSPAPNGAPISAPNAARRQAEAGREITAHGMNDGREQRVAASTACDVAVDA